MLTLRLALHQVKTETFCSCALQAESIENAVSHPRNHNVSSFSDRVESHSVQPYLATAFFTYLCFPRSCFIYHWHPSACPLSRSAVEIMHMGNSNTNFAEMGRFNFEMSQLLSVWLRTYPDNFKQFSGVRNPKQISLHATVIFTQVLYLFLLDSSSAIQENSLLAEPEISSLFPGENNINLCCKPWAF